MNIYMERIRPLFEQSGKTDKQIEEELGLPKGVIYKWGTGKYKSYKTYLPQIAAYFNVSTDYLLGTSDDPAPAGEQKKEPATESLDLDDELNAEFIKLWKRLTPEERVILRAQMRGMLNDRES